MRDAFHQAAVADEHIGAVVDDVEAGPVEFGGEQLLGQRHADRIGQSLSEWSCCGLDARRQAELGMAGRATAELAEAGAFRRWAAHSRSGAAAHTAASSHDRSKARSGHDSASADWPGCATDDRPTARRRFPPCPSACPDGPSWPSAPRPSPARGCALAMSSARGGGNGAEYGSVVHRRASRSGKAFAKRKEGGGTLAAGSFAGFETSAAAKNANVSKDASRLARLSTDLYCLMRER